MNIKISTIFHNNTTNGPGSRAVIFMDNSFAAKEVDIDELFFQILEDERDEGVTIRGSEPIEQYYELTPLLERLRKNGYPIILFTDHSKSDLELLICQKLFFTKFLSTIDFIVSGECEIEYPDTHSLIRDSVNQRILQVEESGRGDCFAVIKDITDEHCK